MESGALMSMMRLGGVDPQVLAARYNNQQAFDTLDADASGTLSKTETQEMPFDLVYQADFHTVDANSDGALTFAESSAGLDAVLQAGTSAPQAPAPPMDSFLNRQPPVLSSPNPGLQADRFADLLLSIRNGS